jgi:hypothetical protein
MSERRRKIQGSVPADPEAAAREEQLRALFQAADPPVRASEALRQRVAEVTAPASRTRRGVLGRVPWRLAFGLAAATVLVMVYTTVAPVWVAARILGRAEAATASAQSVHIITWRLLPDGSRARLAENWIQGTQSRYEDLAAGTVRLHAGARSWLYESKLNKVTVWKEPAGRSFRLSDATMGQITRDLDRMHGRLRSLGDAVLDGRRVHQVALESLNGAGRFWILFDAATDLPVRAEQQREEGGRWVTEKMMEFRFNEPLPASLFVPGFPRTARMFNQDQGREEWQRRLAPGIARQRVGRREIVIRDLQVNAEGDVFLLYSAGKRPGDSFRCGNRWAGRDWNIEVKDDLGTVYLWQMQNFANEGQPGHLFPFVFRGERTEGDGWVPLESQRPWKPRRFTITFRVNAVNLHGDTKGPKRKLTRTETATFTLPVIAPEAAAVPDYMPYLGFGVQEAELPMIRARGRGFYYEYEKPDLPRALEYYREVLRLREESERQTGQHTSDPDAWMEVGNVLRKLGRRDEARAAYRQAIREDSYRGWQAERSKDALESMDGEGAWSPGRPAPSFTATDLDGRQQSPTQYRGRVLLIHVWGAWDDDGGASHADLPGVRTLYQKYHGQGLDLLGIAIYFDNNKVRKIVREQRLTWPQISDGLDYRSPLFRGFGAPRFNHTILIDREGTIRAVGLRGADLDQAVGRLLAAR